MVDDAVSPLTRSTPVPELQHASPSAVVSIITDLSAMSEPEEVTTDALDPDEISDTANPGPDPGDLSTPSKHNAFSELMARKPKAETLSAQPKRSVFGFLGANGLGAYVADPASYPPSRVIYYNADVVAIWDLYPKSSVHTLLLPRSATHTRLHPFDAFADPPFLAMVRVEAEKLKALVSSELRRKYGSLSAQARARDVALEREPPPDVLPVGRDWSASVKVGIHASPSMANLHVHVLSVDRVSRCVRKMPHYNSFATPFFVPLADFPLAEDDVRRHPGREGYLHRDLVCWRCGASFGRKLAALKDHLEEEFVAWQSE
ncbi:MAG: aprataxin-like protein [Thelocarpon superellum]|nr:MAG: aprataxin-like protein [Thelocarpon superellum]